jgi:hypothetical protein
MEQKKFKNQKEMFDYIWDTREHVSEISGEELLPRGHFKWHWQFLHILPKGSYPSYRLNPYNIMLGLPEEHETQETYEVFKRAQVELRIEYLNDVNIKH